MVQGPTGISRTLSALNVPCNSSIQSQKDMLTLRFPSPNKLPDRARLCDMVGCPRLSGSPWNLGMLSCPTCTCIEYKLD